jgi:GDP-L-fucose synthase
MIGAAILQGLRRQSYTHILNGTMLEPNLTDASEVDSFFSRAKPDYVFMAAGKSAGIFGNQKHPATLMLDNLLVESHVIHSAHQHGVKKLLYLASSCCYPKHCLQPMRVESLLTGALEPTSEGYATAKIAGIKLCQAFRQEHGDNFIVGIVGDVFGPEEHLDVEDMHVVPALIRRMYEAKLRARPFVEIWGTGKPRREFMFAEDVADACIFVMREYGGREPINLGGGLDLSIKELAELIKEVVEYRGELRFNSTKPDGMPLKILDSTELRKLGWQAKIPVRSALAATYKWIVHMEEQQTSVSAAVR